MAPPRRPALDNAIDKLAHFIDAESYEQYLAGPYRENRQRYKESWDAHYYNMEIALQRAILKTIERTHIQLEEMNILLVGPGYTPVGNEISKYTIDTFLKRAKTIIVSDISQDVAGSARQSLIDAGLDSNKIMAAQLDVTAGLSTVYLMRLQELFEQVDTEEKYRDPSQQLRTLPISDFEDRRIEYMEKKKQLKQLNNPRRLIDGGDNETRTQRFTVGGEQVPIHLAAYPMVLAGTGAAAGGAVLWERLAEVQEGHVALSGDKDSVALERRDIRENIHQLITRYNTTVAIKTIRDILTDNPKARVVAYTDVNTTYYSDDGEMPRLDLAQMTTELSAKDEILREGAPRIVMAVHDANKWEDEKTHFHGTRVLNFHAIESRKPGDSGPLVQGQGINSMGSTDEQVTQQ